MTPSESIPGRPDPQSLAFRVKAYYPGGTIVYSGATTESRAEHILRCLLSAWESAPMTPSESIPGRSDPQTLAFRAKAYFPGGAIAYSGATTESRAEHILRCLLSAGAKEGHIEFHKQGAGWCYPDGKPVFVM